MESALERGDKFRVFVYDTLKKGGPFDFTNEALSIQKARLYGHTLWYGCYPYIKEGDGCDVVHGELHEYNIGMLQKIDHIESVPDVYQRREVFVETDDEVVKAYAYYPVELSWLTDGETKIENGDFLI